MSKTIKLSIISTKNPELIFNLNFFGDTLSVTLNDSCNKIKYGEIFMKKVSDTNVYMSEFIIHSYKFNRLIDNRLWLKGMGKEMLYVAVTEIMKIYPTLTFLEGKVAAIETIRNESNSRNALVKMYENMGAYIIKDTKLYTEMETKLSDVLLYCKS
jgi:hypothetical protein